MGNPGYPSKIRRRLVGALSLAACTVALSAAGQPAVEGPGIDAPLLLERAFRNLYGEDYVQTMRLETQPRSGRGMTRLIQITRRQSVVPGKALVRFLEPYQVRRTSILILENDGAWRIAHYCLTFPVPNEIAADIVQQIQAHENTAHP